EAARALAGRVDVHDGAGAVDLIGDALGRVDGPAVPRRGEDDLAGRVDAAHVVDLTRCGVDPRDAAEVGSPDDAAGGGDVIGMVDAFEAPHEFAATRWVESDHLGGAALLRKARDPDLALVAQGDAEHRGGAAGPGQTVELEAPWGVRSCVVLE